MPNAIHRRIVSTAASNIEKTRMSRCKNAICNFHEDPPRMLLFFPEVQTEIISSMFMLQCCEYTKITFFIPIDVFLYPVQHRRMNRWNLIGFNSQF